jgi:hypothetical protein
MFDLCTMLEPVWKGVKVASSRADATIINIVSALALVFHFFEAAAQSWIWLPKSSDK